MTHNTDITRISQTIIEPISEEKLDEILDELDTIDSLAEESGFDVFDSMNIPEGK